MYSILLNNKITCISSTLLAYLSPERTKVHEHNLNEFIVCDLDNSRKTIKKHNPHITIDLPHNVVELIFIIEHEYSQD